MTHLIVYKKLQGIDLQDFGNAGDIILVEHCKEHVEGYERKQDCFCLSFRSGNKLFYAHKLYGYRLESGFIG
jgi:hypothetical protein